MSIPAWSRDWPESPSLGAWRNFMLHVDSFVRQKSGNSQNHLVSTSMRLMKAETFLRGQNSRLCWLTKSTWTVCCFPVISTNSKRNLGWNSFKSTVGVTCSNPLLGSFSPEKSYMTPSRLTQPAHVRLAFDMLTSRKHVSWRMSWERMTLKTKHSYLWLGTCRYDVPSLSRACKMCLNVLIVPSTTAVVCYICQWHRVCVLLLLGPLIPIPHTAPWNLIWSKSKQPQALVRGL